MNFTEILSQYIDTLGCTINELSDASNLSPSVISRYKSGKRIPAQDSTQLVNLSNGIINIAREKGLNELEYLTVYESFKQALNNNDQKYEIFSQNFSILADSLSFNIKKLSQYTNFDLSYIYRIKSGQRRPNDIDAFSNMICSYIDKNHSTQDDIIKLAALLDFEYTENLTIDMLIPLIKLWLLENCAKEDNTLSVKENVLDFLQKLNDFNLDEFIKEIHFDDLKIPTVPFRIPTTKSYYGIKEMQKGELDFFKTTVTSRTSKPIYMYSNMPMADMAEDLDFGRKWMFGIAASIKKGLTLNVIHDVDRPLDEMFLGMTSWIPIYMTGQVNGYYLKDYTADVFHTLQYVSGVCALSGECIHSHHDNGRYTLSSAKDDVKYAKKRFKSILEYASPLMEVYTSSNIDELNKYTTYISTHKDSIITLSESPFTNIDIFIKPSDWVMIKKKKAPSISFVIKHTKMVEAFEQYVIPNILKSK